MGEGTRPHNLNIIIIYRGNLGRMKRIRYMRAAIIVIGSKRETKICKVFFANLFIIPGNSLQADFCHHVGKKKLSFFPPF